MSNKQEGEMMKPAKKRALVPALRFSEFSGAGEWEAISLQEASVPVTERVGQRKLTPVSISAGIGLALFKICVETYPASPIPAQPRNQFAEFCATPLLSSV